jgi:hypothetical protein
MFETVRNYYLLHNGDDNDDVYLNKIYKFITIIKKLFLPFHHLTSS